MFKIFLLLIFTNCTSVYAQEFINKGEESFIYISFQPSETASLNISDQNFYPFYSRRSRTIKFDNHKPYYKIGIYGWSAQFNRKFISFIAGDTIILTIDKENNLILKGKDADYQNYINYKRDFNNQIYIPQLEALTNTNLFIDDYKEKCIELFKKDSFFIDSFFQSSAKYQPLKEIELEKARLSLIKNLLSYPYTSDIKAMPDSYLPDFHLNSLLNSTFYSGTKAMAVSSYISFINRKDTVQKNFTDRVVHLIETARKRLPVNASNFYMMNLLDSYSKSGQPTFYKIVEHIYHHLINQPFDKEAISEINTRYQSYKTLQKKLDVYGKIRLRRGDGKIVFLKDIIVDKPYTLIDFWASWCSPCIEELPALKNQKENNSKKVSFISISIDKNESDWEKAILKHNMDPRTSYRFTDLNNKLIRDYGIKSIPVFMLFSVSGSIVNGLMPRPSEQKFQKVLDNSTKN